MFSNKSNKIMLDIKVCTVCFSTEVKLFNMDKKDLRLDYNTVVGLNSCTGDGLPNYLCSECTAYIIKFKKFRLKCHRASFTLLEILKRTEEISMDDIRAIDRETLDLMPSLHNWTLNRVHYKSIQGDNHNRLNMVKGETPLLSKDNSTPDNTVEHPEKLIQDLIKVEVEDAKVSELQNFDKQQTNDTDEEPNGATTVKNNSDNDLDSNADGEQYTENEDEHVNEKDTQLASIGSNLDVEYASLVQLSMKEQAAAAEVYRLSSHEKFKCQVCSKAYQSDRRLKNHLRMHDKHISGHFLCKLCNYYYKTDSLLQTHITEKHLYKYICRECPEVNFDRTTAKQHYLKTHLQNGKRPAWLRKRGDKRKIATVKKVSKLPDDFPVYSPVTQPEQYEIVNDRRKSKNYLESRFKCESCFRGFRMAATYDKHMRKHDSAVSGKMTCDMCKLCFRNSSKMYHHMISMHLFKYSCRMCSFVCYNRNRAYGHYKWHKNVTYKCPHCNQEFSKLSTQLTHIRVKHPSTNICNICGHSFVSETGLYCHKKQTHSKEEIETSDSKIGAKSTENKLYCEECKIAFLSEEAFVTHLGSSNKHTNVNLSVLSAAKSSAKGLDSRRSGRPSTRPRGPSEVHNMGIATATACEECGEHLPSDVQARKHYQTEHPGVEFLKRYMCDVCGHATKTYTNLLVHMRTHTNEKPYACPHCDRRFGAPSNRDRHLVVHTGEKRYECEHCHKRFTQSGGVKLHIQTEHLKIPYAQIRNRKRRRREMDLDTAQQDSKSLADTQTDYLNAYISYHDE